MFVFLHFNKAGGTTFVEIAKQNCSLYPSKLDGIPLDENGNIIYWWQPELAAAYLASPDYDMLCIEVSAADSEHHAMQTVYREYASYITVVRHPLDMLYSRYNHLCSINCTPKKSVKDFLINDLRANFITTILSDSWDKPNLDLAIDKINQFDIVMVLESYHKDLQAMQKKFGWKHLHNRKYRSGTRNGSNFYKDFKDDKEFVKIMEDKHSLDLALYNYIVENKDRINR